MLLIVGSSKDHNTTRLADAARARGVVHRLIHCDTDPAPAVHWQPGTADIIINGETFATKGTSLFIRYDVFSVDDADRKNAFFDSLRGWAEANPEVGLLNRRNETMEMNKPRALVLARDCGFDVPETFVTSDFNRFANKDRYIAKPVSGGSYTRLLSDVDTKTDRPWIVQEKLDYPELRLFRVGKYYFAFSIESELIDYRVDKNPALREVDPPLELVAAMQKLTDKMGLDYAAADFKTDPKTGRLKFLEINTMPMLAGYDNKAQGRLSDALCLVVTGLSTPLTKTVPAPSQSRSRHA